MTAKALLEAKEALEECSTEMILPAYAEDAVFIDVPAGKRVVGEAELRAYFDALFSLPGVAFSEVSIFDGGDFAAIEWTWSGVRGTGERYSIRGASVIELREGKIARESIYYDPRAALA